MKKLKDTPFYHKAIQEINYSFGNFYLFDTFVVGEIKEDILFTWEDHGKILMDELSNLYDNAGEDIIYISHRVHDYSTNPMNWTKFHKNSYTLKAYGIISYTKTGFYNAMLERMFINTKVRWFSSLESAINWVGEFSESDVLVPKN